MGDSKMITASERNVLHRADSGAMRFKVKVPLPGLGPALTFTAKHNPFLELYRIVIGRPIKVINLIVEDQKNRKVTPFSLINMEFQQFQEFWITWYNKKIRMGVWGEKTPFLEYSMHTNIEIGYVQFNTMSRNWSPVEWIIETSPVILKTLPTKYFESRLRWAPMQNGKLPEGAMIGGFESEPIYIARAYHNNSLCPGKYVPSAKKAFVPWGRREHAKTEFEILCGHNAKWVKTKLNFIPNNAFIGGHSEVHDQPLYIGRAMYDGKLLTGTVHVNLKTCYLPWNSKEIEVSSYEILVIPEDDIPQALPFDLLQQGN